MVEEVSSVIEKAKQWLFKRQLAYKKTFQGPFAEDVLKDLAIFCRAHESCFHEDPRLHAELEGRREVWLRIQHHLELKNDELWEKYRRKDL